MLSLIVFAIVQHSLSEHSRTEHYSPHGGAFQSLQAGRIALHVAEVGLGAKYVHEKKRLQSMATRGEKMSLEREKSCYSSTTNMAEHHQKGFDFGGMEKLDQVSKEIHSDGFEGRTVSPLRRRLSVCRGSGR